VVNDTAPFGSVDLMTGEAIGFDYDLVTEIARRLNLHIERRFLSRDSLSQAVATRGVEFGLGAIALTAETAAAGFEVGLAGSQPYLARRQQIRVRADGPRYPTVDALASDPDALIGAVGGSPAFYIAAYDILQGDNLRERIILSSSEAATIAALQAGEVDAVVVDAAAARSLRRRSGGGIAVMEANLAREEYVLVFPSGSDLLGPFNAAIAALQADGFIDDREEYWFYLREAATTR
jgi:polar amino acid transport system substrate-binding protein